MGLGILIRAGGRALANVVEASGNAGGAAAIRGGTFAVASIVDPVGTTISVVLDKVLRGNGTDDPDVDIDI